MGIPHGVTVTVHVCVYMYTTCDSVRSREKEDSHWRPVAQSLLHARGRGPLLRHASKFLSEHIKYHIIQQQLAIPLLPVVYILYYSTQFASAGI